LIALLGLKWTLVISQIPYVGKWNFSKKTKGLLPSDIFCMLRRIITRKHILCIQVLLELSDLSFQ
jgi:hypothetical protein